MSLNKRRKMTLKALTRLEPNVKSAYKIMRRFSTAASRFYTVPLSYTVWDGEIINGEHSIPIRIFGPLHDYTESLLLFFHGGGWVTGNIDSYSHICSRMAKITNSIVVSVDYRLAPEHKFPTGLMDCYTVAKTLLTDGSLEINPKNITLVGDSAGGNIAAALSLMARDIGDFLPTRQILLYPSTYNDHSPASPFQSVHENGEGFILTSKRISDYTELYRSSDDDLNNPYFAPLLAKDFSNQPETLIISAQYDLLRDEGEEYGRRLAEAGNKVRIHRINNALHGFISLPPKAAQVKEAYSVINDFLYGNK